MSFRLLKVLRKFPYHHRGFSHPQNKAHLDPLEGRGPTKGLQPSFSTGRTQLTQFCQDTFSSWGRGQAFPSGFGCAKAGILCSSIPICPPLTVLCDNFLAHGADDEISPLFVSV